MRNYVSSTHWKYNVILNAWRTVKCYEEPLALICNQGVTGSNPVVGTIDLIAFYLIFFEL